MIHIVCGCRCGYFCSESLNLILVPSEGTEQKLFIRILLTLSVAAKIKLAFHKVPTCISDSNSTTGFKGDDSQFFGMLISRGAEKQTRVLKFTLVSTLIIDHFYVKQRWEKR